MKVALYARVSKDDSTQDPENQLVPMRKYCESMNWEVTKEFVDRASGGNSNRPQFQAMLAEVRQRHFDLILVWALDRFSREGISNTLSYIKQLKDYKTAIKSMQDSWLDTRTEGVSELILAVMAWVAEQERKRISERVIAGLARVKKEYADEGKGRKLGRPWHKVKPPLETPTEKTPKTSIPLNMCLNKELKQ